MTSLSLNEEQKKFLDECEEEFKNRYTDDDSEFVKIKNNAKSVPPIIDPWYKKQPGRFDWTKQNRGKRKHDNWNQNYRHDKSKYSRHNDRDRYDRDRH